MAAPSPIRERVRFRRIDEFGGFDMLEARYHRQRFSRHVHDTFCIGVIEDGAQRFYRSGAEHVAPKGDIILINADDVHTGSAEREHGWAYRAIYPHPDLFRLVSRDWQGAAGTVPWFPDAVLHDPRLAEHLRMIFSLLARPSHALLKETLLLSSLGRLMRHYSRTRPSPRAPSAAVQQVRGARERIDAHPEADLSLLDLADTAGLSPWHFLRQFKAAVGIPPHAYQVQARLRLARTLLLAGHAPAAVSLQCGFTDQSHFTRHFKKALGLTPGAFARGRHAGRSKFVQDIPGFSR
jgi:AraC-like DNA-binding protein